MANWDEKGYTKIPQKTISADDFQTPFYAIDCLIPYLNKEWIIWECASGKGNLVKAFKNKGFKVIGTDLITNNSNFLTYKPLLFDCIITNPPYSKKQEFLKRCYSLNVPFALLLPLTALESEKRQKLFREYNLQLIIPNKRINFETPSGKGKNSWFATAWFCGNMNLPKDLNFIELNRGVEK